MAINRRSQKAVMAARILADILRERMSDVIDAYSADEMYLNLKSMNYYWDTNLQSWFLKQVSMEKQRASTRTPLRASIRVMAANKIDAEVMRQHLMALIEQAGGSIERVGGVSSVEPDGTNARAHFDILL